MLSKRPDPGTPAKSRLWLFLALAALLHLGGAAVVAPYLVRPSSPPIAPRARVRLVPVDHGLARSRPARPVTPREEERRRRPERLEGQVVDLPPAPDATPPENARFLSEHDTRVARETVSRHQTKDYEVARNQRPASDASGASTAPTSGGQPPTSPNAARQKPASDLVLQLSGRKRRTSLALALDSDLGRLRNEPRSREGDSENHGAQEAAPKRALTIGDLTPTVAQLARILGAPPNDYLENVEEGEGTFLNAREFKYASFFNRVKRVVSERWDPTSGGRVPGSGSRLTIVNVTLDREGGVKGIELARSSGAEALDRAAISAFRRAECFPNPPEGLVSPDGLITFAFGFHVDDAPRGGLQRPRSLPF